MDAHIEQLAGIIERAAEADDGAEHILGAVRRAVPGATRSEVRLAAFYAMTAPGPRRSMVTLRVQRFAHSIVRGDHPA